MYRSTAASAPKLDLLTVHPPAPPLCAGCSSQELQSWTSPAKLGQVNMDNVVLTTGKNYQKNVLSKCISRFSAFLP